MKIQVNKDNVKIVESDKVESGEYNITELEFEFTEEYEGLVKKAVFTNSNGSYKVDIVDNKCRIANEVLDKEIINKKETVKIGVYAYELQDEQLIKRYSPTPTYFRVKEGSYVKNANNSEEPTPSEVEQLESRIQQNADNIETLDEVISGLHNYDDTEIKNDISVLEDKVDNLHNYDDTGIKQDISSIERKNTEQDTSIQNLQNNKADKAEIPTNLSDLNEDTTHRTVTDVEKESWNNKSEFSGSYNDLTDKPSIPTKTSDITNDSGFIDKDVDDLTNYELKTNTGSSIALSINSSTYVMTLQLKNSNNEVLSEGNIDLPLETMVVNATYDNNTKEIVLTLQSGTTTRFSVADLVSGLVSTTELNTVLASYYTKTEIDDLLGNKVDKVAGKSLISDTEIERLANVDNYDDSEVKQDINNIQDEQETQNINITDLINTVNAIKNMGCIVTYTNKDDNREIFLKKMINKGQTLAPPDESELSLNKRDFNGWILNDNLYEYDSENQGYYYEGTSLTDAIQSLTSSNEDVYVYGSFEFYMVSVEGGTITTSDERTITDGSIMVRPNTNVNINANVPENMYFDKWIDENNNKYSAINNFNTNVKNNLNLKSIFSSEYIEILPDIFFINEKCYISDYNKVTYDFKSEIPTNYRKNNWGILLSTKSNDINDFVIGNSLVTNKNITTLATENMASIKFTATYGQATVSEHKTVYGRCYATIEDLEGNQSVIYSNELAVAQF